MKLNNTHKAVSVAVLTALSLSAVSAKIDSVDGFAWVEDPKASLTASQVAFIDDAVVIDASEPAKAASNTWMDYGMTAAKKVVGQACGVALSTQLDPATNMVSQAIETGVTAVTGSPMLGKVVKIGMYDAVRENTASTLKAVGQEIPNMAVGAYKFYTNPLSALEVVGAAASKAVNYGAQTVASYLLSEPLDRALSMGVYAGALGLTQNPLVATAASSAVTAGANYLGLNKYATSAVGTYAVQGVKSALSGAYNWFYGS